MLDRKALEAMSIGFTNLIEQMEDRLALLEHQRQGLWQALDPLTAVFNKRIEHISAPFVDMVKYLSDAFRESKVDPRMFIEFAEIDVEIQSLKADLARVKVLQDKLGELLTDVVEERASKTLLGALGGNELLNNLDCCGGPEPEPTPLMQFKKKYEGGIKSLYASGHLNFVELIVIALHWYAKRGYLNVSELVGLMRGEWLFEEDWVSVEILHKQVASDSQHLLMILPGVELVGNWHCSLTDAGRAYLPAALK